MTDADSGSQPYPSTPYAWYVVGVLLVLYTFSFIDRTIISLMVGPIRASFDISDTQLSLLHGFAFALFYTMFGIPVARLADNRSRKVIITVGTLIWAGMTTICGLTQSYIQLFLARMGVGVGEASLSPAAYSLIADYFEPRKLPQALSVYSMGVFLGSGLAYVLGGAVIAYFPPLVLPYFGAIEAWQSTFIYVGLPALVVLVLFQTVREPVRRGRIGPAAGSQEGTAAGGQDEAGEKVSLRQALAFVSGRRRVYGFHFLGFSLLAMVWTGTAAWMPTLFIRLFDWSRSDAGFYLGAATLVFSPLGILAGGWCAGWLADRGHRDGAVRTGLIAAVGMLPFGIMAPLAGDPWVAFALYCPFLFFVSFPWGAAVAALHFITPNRLRAQVAALFLFCINLMGIGIGPSLVAVITDYGFGYDGAVGLSLSISVALATPLGALILWQCGKAYVDQPQVTD